MIVEDEQPSVVCNGEQDQCRGTSAVRRRGWGAGLQGINKEEQLEWIFRPKFLIPHVRAIYIARHHPRRLQIQLAVDIVQLEYEGALTSTTGVVSSLLL